MTVMSPDTHFLGIAVEFGLCRQRYISICLGLAHADTARAAINVCDIIRFISLQVIRRDNSIY